MDAALTTEILIVAAIFIVAILYSSVGHGGASGYLAVLAFLAVAPNVTKPTALVLNVFVASIAAFQFYRRGYFDWKIFSLFAATSIPAAFLGGMISLPTQVYKQVLGAVLLLAAFRLAWNFETEKPIAAPALWLALVIGAVIGFLSGLVGVGGGIFLTPILLLTNWTDTRKAAGISAAFILVNSIAGLVGNLAQGFDLPASVWFWVSAAIGGGVIGSSLGSKYFEAIVLRRVLAIVLLTASIKLIFT